MCYEERFSLQRPTTKVKKREEPKSVIDPLRPSAPAHRPKPETDKPKEVAPELEIVWPRLLARIFASSAFGASRRWSAASRSTKPDPPCVDATPVRDSCSTTTDRFSRLPTEPTHRSRPLATWKSRACCSITCRRSASTA
jgi:hypothetical protein